MLTIDTRPSMLRDLGPWPGAGVWGEPMFERLSREMDRLLGGAAEVPSHRPSLDVWRDGETVVIEAELPGSRLEDIEVLAGERMVTIRGRREPRPADGATALRLERSAASFERTVGLPFEIDAARAEASLDDGVLRLRLPVSEAHRPRRIEVKPGGPRVLPGSAEEPSEGGSSRPEPGATAK